MPGPPPTGADAPLTARAWPRRCYELSPWYTSDQRSSTGPQALENSRNRGVLGGKRPSADRLTARVDCCIYNHYSFCCHAIGDRLRLCHLAAHRAPAHAAVRSLSSQGRRRSAAIRAPGRDRRGRAGTSVGDRTSVRDGQDDGLTESEAARTQGLDHVDKGPRSTRAARHADSGRP